MLIEFLRVLGTDCRDQGLYAPKPIKFENYNRCFGWPNSFRKKAIPNQINSDIFQNFGMGSSNELNAVLRATLKRLPRHALTHSTDESHLRYARKVVSSPLWSD
jgi:hypothetical protein